MTQSYGTTAKFLHWLIAALLIGQYLLGWLMPDIKRGMTPGIAMNLHISIGFVALVLIVARFAWRFTHPVAPDAGLPQWQRVASESVHLVIYLLVLVTTLTGWFYAAMRGWTLVLFGVVPLPGLVSQGSALGRTLGQLHGKDLGAAGRDRGACDRCPGAPVRLPRPRHAADAARRDRGENLKTGG
jgi:cytochrome b561